ncbi:Uncharacterized protein APZ42_004843 [Daphnia magna]|uniref:Uncharacterized protein n=1 Tax=Daphnia magna TaxID=35525 RepID=A0A164GT90_9CRUS|nr:Uncharacterized protein APZ42_004843 [Daphnia magna]
MECTDANTILSNLFSTISDAPLVKTRYPPPSRAMTVLIDLRLELKV